MAAELLPFQQIPNLPTNTSLTLGNTTYDTPDDLDAMPFLSGGVALDNFGGHDDQGRLASAINFRGLLDPSDLLSLRSMGSAEAGHYHWGTYHLAVGPLKNAMRTGTVPTFAAISTSFVSIVTSMPAERTFSNVAAQSSVRSAKCRMAPSSREASARSKIST